MKIISPDTYIYNAEGQYDWSPERKSAAWDRAFHEFHALASSGRFTRHIIMCGIPGAGKTFWSEKYGQEGDLIFDACVINPDIQNRVRRLSGASYKTATVWMDTPLEVCLERNAQRSADRIVPEDQIRSMHQYLQENLPNPDYGNVYRMSSKGLEEVCPEVVYFTD